MSYVIILVHILFFLPAATISKALIYMAEKGEAEIKMRFNSSCKMEEREKTNI